MQITTPTKENDYYTFLIPGQIQDLIANSINALLLDDGYKVEEGDKYNGVYGIGSNAMRLFFGALVKRFRFGVSISEENNNTKIIITKSMSGASGGVIGMKKLNAEFIRIAELINQKLASSPVQK